MVTVMGLVRAEKGQYEALGQVLSRMAVEVKKQPGNQRYDLFRSVDDHAAYLLYEAYVDDAGFEAHDKTEAMQALTEELIPLVDWPMDIQIFHED